MEDQELIRIIRQDPARGWDILMKQYTGLLWHVARGILAGREDIEDTVAEVFVEAFGQWDRFDPARGSLKSWLATMALRRAIDRRRRQKPQVELDETMAAEETAILDELVARETRQALLTRLDDLGEPDRTMVIDRFFFRRASREMAITYQMTPNAIDQRISRALAKLRNQMEEQGYEIQR